MGLLPFFKGDLSGTSFGFWGECACVYTLTAIDFPVDADSSAPRWNVAYTGNLEITQVDNAAFGSVTPLKVLQSSDILDIERQVGDGESETAHLVLFLGGGLGAGVLTEDGKVEYGGSMESGSKVLFQHRVFGGTPSS
jgi:hypothetical protein